METIKNSLPNEKIMTAEELAKSKCPSYDRNPIEYLTNGDLYVLMREFAQLHVDLALRRAHSNMQLPLEDLEFTLESYPLTNIK